MKQAERRKKADRTGTVQYTVREVPAHVDRELRRRARGAGKSLNAYVRDALARVVGGPTETPVPHHDLDALAGAWEDDPELDRALAEQDRVDEGLWR